MNILLVEPKSSTTYPPLGLMKIATYHKIKGDFVSYVIGKDKDSYSKFWDLIYITTCFTYDIKQAIDTIKFYSSNLFNFKKIVVGGISATLLPDLIQSKTGVKIHKGLLDSRDEFLIHLSFTDKRFNYLQECTPCIDNLPPDYAIFPENSKYNKILDSSYILYATKGCPNRCKFCAVSTLEPKFIDYIPIKPRIDYIDSNFGKKSNLILLDNNIAASQCYFKIIDELIDCGFHSDSNFIYEKSGKAYSRKRTLDFNQGVDARLMTEEKMQAMSKICIKPLRLAFDNIKYKDIYLDKCLLAIKNGIKNISNYMLYNNDDRPEELYERMLVNTKIKEENSDIQIFSFPMRYSPVIKTDRHHIGKYWHRRQIRAFQLILNATHGIVSHKPNFFYRAFGKNVDEFLELLSMPLKYIINRNLYEVKIPQCFSIWRSQFNMLNNSDKITLLDIVDGGHTEYDIDNLSDILRHYKDDNAIVVAFSEHENEKKIFLSRFSEFL